MKCHYCTSVPSPYSAQNATLLWITEISCSCWPRGQNHSGHNCRCRPYLGTVHTKYHLPYQPLLPMPRPANSCTDILLNSEILMALSLTVTHKVRDLGVN